MIQETQSSDHLKILITAPNLATKRNVSGISTVVRQIIRNSEFEFVHFEAGRHDKEKAGILWLIRQVVLPLRFAATLVKSKADAIHLNSSLETLSIFRDAALSFVAVFFGKPVILHIHGGRFLFSDHMGSLSKYALSEMFHSATRIIVLSDLERQMLRERWPSLEFEVLQNAVEITDRELPERTGGKPVIIFLGRIHESKGLDVIIESCRRLLIKGFEFEFRCFGTGPDEKQFIDQLSEILGDSFSFGGVVSGKQKREALGRADIFLLPSRFEGLPLSLLEAMSVGCVPVATDVGSIATVIDNGENGFLVEPGNVGQVVGKLRYLLENESDLIRLKANACKRIEADFAMSDYIVRLGRIYRNLG